MDKLKAGLVRFIRQSESRNMHGDPERLEQLAAVTDDYLLKKYLLTAVIIGAPVVFIAVPFILSMFSGFLPQTVLTICWAVAKFLMLLAFILVAITIFITVRSDN